MKIKIIKFIGLLLVIVILNSCVSVAKISDFPKASNQVDFNKYSKEYKEKQEPFWTAETSNEYYFEKNKVISETDLRFIILAGLKDNGYRSYGLNQQNDCVLAKRGLRANEWNSITGVYYQLDNKDQNIQIYINTKITQDITGGWRENRAKKIGIVIEKMIDSK